MIINKAMIFLWIGIGCGIVSASEEKPKWIDEGPYVDKEELFIELPLEVLATKLFVEVEVGGKPRRFVFDTGSPSMMSKQLAKELQLKVIDKQQGRDAHGALIETQIVQSDLTIGNVTFHKVPVYVADFPKTAQCLFDGVIGSELLPLCAWQIDLPAGKLRCSSDITTLNHIKTATEISLHSFGYPHTPYLDIQLAEQASSKAMFDTGASEYFMISPPDFEGAQRNGGTGKITSGQGSMGGSLGGQAAHKEHHKVQLKSLSVSGLPLEKVIAPIRVSPPSLLGASLLEHFVVTLDSKNGTSYFDLYKKGPLNKHSYGFGMSYQDTPQVSMVWNESPASTAGLKVGQAVTAINGQPTKASCDSIRHAMRAMSEGNELTVEVDGKLKTLTR